MSRRLPDAALSAPGHFHNWPITGHPRAGDATLLNGEPVVPLYLGRLEGAVGEVELDITSATELDEIEFAVRQARSRLAAYYPVTGGEAA